MCFKTVCGHSDMVLKCVLKWCLFCMWYLTVSQENVVLIWFLSVLKILFVLMWFLNVLKVF